MEMNEKKNQNGTELEPDKNSKKWMDCPALRKVLKIICAKFGAITMSASMRKKAKSDIFFQLT